MEVSSPSKSFLPDKRILALITCLSIYCTEGLASSVLAPFFPTYALSCGLGESEVGLIQGICDVSNFVSQLLVGFFVSPKNRKCAYIIGVFVFGVSNVIFALTGVMQEGAWIFLCSILSRVSMGSASSIIYAGTVPTLSKLYPHRVATLTAIAQTFRACGQILGPPIGSLMAHSTIPYNWSGYTAPCILFGLFHIILSVFAGALTPGYDHHQSSPSNNKQKVRVHDYSQFLLLPLLQCVSIPALFVAALFGFKDVAFGPHLQNQLGIKVGDIGYYFTIIGVTCSVMAPLCGCLVAKGYAGYILMICMHAQSIALLLWFGSKLFEPTSGFLWPSITLVISEFILTGAIIAALFNSSFAVFERVALRNGIEDKESIKLMSASWLATLRAMGKFIGSFLLGGIVLQNLDFYWTCSIFAAVNIIFSFVVSISLHQTKLLSSKSIQ